MNTKYSLILAANGVNVAEFDAREVLVVASGIIARRDAAPVEAAPVEAAPAPISRQPTAGDVLNFLTSHPQYTKRSFAALESYFFRTPVRDLDELIDQLTDTGCVRTLRRRGDGVTLFEATGKTPRPSPVPEATTAAATASMSPQAVSEPAPQIRPALTLNESNLVAFLRTDPRFNWRTQDAVQAFFSCTATQANEALSEACAVGCIEWVRRGSDGALIYRAL